MSDSGNKVIYLEKAQTAEARQPANEYGRLAGGCHDVLFKTLEEGMEELFTQLDDDLYKLAENSASNARQTLFFDAMRSIRLLQKGLKGDFFNKVEETYHAFWNGGAAASSLLKEEQESGGLSLVEKDELEEDLAISTMVNRANGESHRELNALNRRFAKVSGRDAISLAGNPVSPVSLATAFRSALSQWDADVLARIVAYKCFDRTVLKRMADAYTTMNHFLAEEGVLPELWREGPRHYPPIVPGKPGEAVSPAAHTENSGLALEEQEPAPGQQNAKEQLSLETLWRHIQQLEGLSVLVSRALPTKPDLPVLSAFEVGQKLGRLQQELLGDPDLPQMDLQTQQEFVREQLAQALGQDEQGRATHRVGERERQTIDVILSLFNQILDDPALPDAMRALIGRLQIPVVKAAILDSGFVENEAHPARRLLDELARASMGWRDDGRKEQDPLYQQVKRAVDRIAHDFNDDVALFEEVRQEFSAWLSQVEQARLVKEKRLAQAATGEERLAVAGMEVEKVLKTLRVSSLPEEARTILEGPWKKLLTILWLREGEKGQSWRQAVELARLLARHLRGEIDRERLLSAIPKIMSSLKKGFAYISMDNRRSAQLLNSLQNCFIRVLRPGAPPLVAAAVEEEEPEVTGNRQQEREPDEFDRQADTMEEGTWIRLAEEGQEPVVCKLMWRSRHTGTMVFVDGQGQKAAQLKEHELAEAFRQGRATLLQDAQKPLLERAVKKLFRVLNAEVVGPRLKLPEEE